MDTEGDFEFEPEERTAARGLVVTKSKLSEITGFAPVTIDKHLAAGAPIIAKGTRKQGWQIDTAAYIGWVIRTKVKDATGDPESASFDVEKRLDKKAQRRLRELEIAEREGVLIPVDDVVKWAGEKYGVVRSRLFAMESQMPDLTGDQRETFRTLLNDALSEITGYRMEDAAAADDADEEELEDVRAAR